MSNCEYLEKYIEGQDSYKNGSFGFALENFMDFINLEKHPKNSLELPNAYRYVAKLQYEEGDYIESLTTWCHKSTRSCFTWKDFYSRALAALFGFKEKMDSGNFVLLFETRINYEYTILDALIDISMAKTLILEEREKHKTSFNTSYRENKTRLLESFHNSIYYEAIFTNLFYQVKNIFKTPVHLNINSKKYKIYNKKIKSRLENEVENINDIIEDYSNEFEHGMALYCDLAELKIITASLFADTERDGCIRQSSKNAILRLFDESESDQYEFTLFDFIPKEYIKMEHHILGLHLFSISNKLNSIDKVNQQDLWNAYYNVGFDFTQLKNPRLSIMAFVKNDWEFDRSITSFSPFHSDRVCSNSSYKLKIFFNSHIFNIRFQICLNHLLEKTDGGFTFLFSCAEGILEIPTFIPSDSSYLNERERGSTYYELENSLIDYFPLFSLYDFKSLNLSNRAQKFLDVIFLKYLILKRTNDYFNNNQLNININHNNFYEKLREMNMMVHYEKCNLYYEIHQLLSGDLELINEYIVDEGDNDYYNEIVTEIIQETKGLKSVELFHNRKDNDEFAGQLINYFKHKYKIY